MRFANRRSSQGGALWMRLGRPLIPIHTTSSLGPTAPSRRNGQVSEVIDRVAGRNLHSVRAPPAIRSLRGMPDRRMTRERGNSHAIRSFRVLCLILL